MADEKKQPYDQRLANQAAAIDHCMKLGGVVIKPKANGLGFTRVEPPEVYSGPPGTPDEPY